VFVAGRILDPYVRMSVKFDKHKRIAYATGERQSFTIPVQSVPGFDRLDLRRLDATSDVAYDGSVVAWRRLRERVVPMTKKSGSTSTAAAPGFTSHGTRKVALHLKGEDQKRFDELRKMLSPVDPERFPLTEVLLYCLNQTWESKIGSKHQK
jgi:hypothetical protein